MIGTMSTGPCLMPHAREAALLDLRQCSSSPTVELSLKSGRGTTMIGTMSTGPCLMPHARTDLVQERRHGRRLLHPPQGLHRLWLWSLCGRHRLCWLLRFLFANKPLLFIFSLKESMSKDQIVPCLENKKKVWHLNTKSSSVSTTVETSLTLDTQICLGQNKKKTTLDQPQAVVHELSLYERF